PSTAQIYTLSLHDALPILALARGDELVVEAEPVEEVAQHRVVVVREAFEPGGERIGNAAQRLAEVRFHQRLVGYVVRHLAQPVQDRKSTRLNSRHVKISLG